MSSSHAPILACDRDFPSGGAGILSWFLASVLFASHGEGTKLNNATDHASSNLGTARMITEVFTKDLFVTVPGLDTRLYGYERNRELQARCLIL
jgi:hypothetical protein